MPESGAACFFLSFAYAHSRKKPGVTAIHILFCYSQEGEADHPSKERKEIGWLKELAAFSNTEGGTLYVGVSDSTHEVHPMGHKEFDAASLMVQRLAKERIEPPLDYRIQEIPVKTGGETAYVMAIVVKPCKLPPTVLHSHGMGVIYCRHSGVTSVATGEEIRAMVLSSDTLSYDLMETEIPFEKERFRTLFDAYKEKHGGKELTEKELISIGFMSPEGKLRKGALLFEDGEEEGNHAVSCTQFLGASKGNDTFYATEWVKGNLLEQLQGALSFVKSRTANGFVKTAQGSNPLLSYPERSLTEAIVNAMGHRNYFIQGSQIEVNLFKDRLQIVSPGSLIGKRWLKHETNLSSLPPLRRNHLICDVFSLLDLMNKKESGFDKIEEDYQAYGEAYRPFADSDNLSFSLTMADLAHRGGYVESQESPALHVVVPTAGKSDLKILSYCYNQARSVSEIASFLSLSPSTYFRKNTLSRLSDQGYLIENTGNGAVRYRTNPEKVILD